MDEVHEFLGNNRLEDVRWLCTLSESELDMLISLKMLVIQRAKVLGHKQLAMKFDLKMLRILDHVKRLQSNRRNNWKKKYYFSKEFDISLNLHKFGCDVYCRSCFKKFFCKGFFFFFWLTAYTRGIIISFKMITSLPSCVHLPRSCIPICRLPQFQIIQRFN
ncbi:uncharacterized protein LOC110639858 isoform X1 [Hevea brasiliensis]|uniref:uncharacterized protein LOC110639858 isoform X1 n=1 Tax=Hevea brasiliensis TaxID=3981 RepID=UPI0025F2EC4C|nr:uncharacterized protein LOC110639858 isoform X1 [Hevea brasiliensis]XP_057986082.1 uncharacterized protein LOC110639858 isoform X1 [Hevea brasiliensis]